MAYFFNMPLTDALLQSGPSLRRRCNPHLCRYAAVVPFLSRESHARAPQDESLLMSLVQRHLKYTGSTVARALLNNWSMARAAFVKVFPPEYRHALEQQATERVRVPTP